MRWVAVNLWSTVSHAADRSSRGIVQHHGPISRQSRTNSVRITFSWWSFHWWEPIVNLPLLPYANFNGQRITFDLHLAERRACSLHLHLAQSAGKWWLLQQFETFRQNYALIPVASICCVFHSRVRSATRSGHPGGATIAALLMLRSSPSVLCVLK